MDFSERIANHCAPAMAGLKPSNLISYPATSGCQALTFMNELNAQLNQVGIFFRCLHQSSARSLFLVYREPKLVRHLNRPEVQSALSQYGYDYTQGLSGLLDQLAARLEEADFPHEIAYFLGYPPEDIQGFIENRGQGFCLNGYWKVYHNPQQAKRAFLQYTCCRRAVTQRIRQGYSIPALFGVR